ncbi:hypothetical protein [Parapedobacter tibetensis]|nr:hypothetical protein [Parapedobacter tibetensis]
MEQGWFMVVGLSEPAAGSTASTLAYSRRSWTGAIPLTVAVAAVGVVPR